MCRRLRQDVGAGRAVWFRAVLGVLAVLAGCAAPPQAGVCEMREIAALPVLNNRAQPIVAAQIDGRKVAFVVDTGARVSVLFTGAVSMLGLQTSFGNHHILDGIGGVVYAPDVTVRELHLDHAVARNIIFASAGPMQGSIDGLPVVGLFGGDFLANYNVEFDLPDHRVSLYAERGCTAQLRPWPAGAFYRLPFTLENDTRIDLPIAVDGHPVDAVLDSGAERTTLDSAAGRQAGVTDSMMATDRRMAIVGIGGTPTPLHVHRFDSLAIGPERIGPVLLPVGRTSLTLLGADYFRGRRVWVSYPHQVVYVQRVPALRARPPAGDPAGGSKTVPP